MYYYKLNTTNNNILNNDIRVSSKYYTIISSRFRTVYPLLQLVGRRETTAATGPRVAEPTDGTYGHSSTL